MPSDGIECCENSASYSADLYRQIPRDEAGISSLRFVPERLPHRGGDGLRGTVRLVRQAVEDAEHDEEDGHLRHQRQTRGHGIDLVLLVELHHLFVELRLVVAMLVLQLAHLRREPLHLEHALGALQRQRRGHGHDDRGDHRDGGDVAAREAVEPRQQNGRNREHWSATLLAGQGLAGGARSVWADLASGTGSHPEGPNGRHRTRRRTVRDAPRRVPWVSKASSA